MTRSIPLPAIARPARRLLGVLSLCSGLLLGLASPVTAGEVDGCESFEGCPCLEDLIAHQVDRGWVGIQMEPDAEGRWTLEMVHPGSPAAKATMKAGDVLLALNGVPYDSEHYGELDEVYTSHGPGDTLVYTVGRDRAKLDLEVTLAPVPPKLMALFVGQQVLKIYARSTGKGPYAEEMGEGKGAHDGKGAKGDEGKADGKASGGG